MSLESDIRKLRELFSMQVKLNDLISEEEAAAELGMSKESLIKAVSSKKIPADWYTLNAIGKRKYKLSKIRGLETY